MLFALLVGLSACSPNPAPKPIPSGEATTIKVAAASDLRFALPEVIARFEKENPSIKVEPTFGSSGNFVAQISQGADFDVFLSADIDYPRELIKKDLAWEDTLHVYAIGRIVVWVPTESKLNVEGQGLEVVLDPHVHKIAIANPRHAPYGRAAKAALKHEGWEQETNEKLVLAENVAQAAQFVETAAADVGIIALSLARAPALSKKGRFRLIPPETYPPLEQASVILRATSHRSATELFQQFLLHADGKNILRDLGFVLPGE
jgi:molybdate transport system substrate-binding protein